MLRRETEALMAKADTLAEQSKNSAVSVMERAVYMGLAFYWMIRAVLEETQGER